MYNICKNAICLLLIHLLICIVCTSAIHIFAIVMFSALGDNIAPIIYSLLDFLIVVLLIGRLFILPIAYKILENSKNFNLISQFIKILKQSHFLKIVVLILSYYIPCVSGISYDYTDFYKNFVFSLCVGFLGNYLVLFFYWFIEDKIKKFQKKKPN